MSAPVRVRFAPSPTGYLHVGGARTALFNWLYARRTGGTFVLRLEDTDQARNSQAAVDVILSGLRWLGLDWDEGPTGFGVPPSGGNTPQPPEGGTPNMESKGDHGPYFQSQRGEIYRRRADELKAAGHAYEKNGALFFQMTREPVTIPDLVVGDVIRPLTDREALDPDWVLIRSDGVPVFHFVNVVDDLEMGITHVIRGEDHLSNTAKHVALFRAFGVEPPKYAHIPLILNLDGSKMSKRDQGASVQSYVDDGYLPEAVLNYLSLLGWSAKDVPELFTKEEIAPRFELADINRANARFDLKKLEHFHFEHTRRLEPKRFVQLGVEALLRAGIHTAGFEPSYVAAALLTAQEKGKLFKELPFWTGFYFVADDAVVFDPEAKAKALTPAALPVLRTLGERFAALPEFNATSLEATLKTLATELGVKVGALVQPCRVAGTGRLVGPSLYHLLEVLGRERVARRMARAVL